MLNSPDNKRGLLDSLKRLLKGKKENSTVTPDTPQAVEISALNTETVPSTSLVPVKNSQTKKEEQKSLDASVLFSLAFERISNPDEAVVIPAYEGNEEVRIFPNPAYFSVDHGMTMRTYDDDFIPLRRRATPSYYAAYLMRVGQRNELRFLTLPVCLFPSRNSYNQQILKDMTDQGFEPERVQQIATYQKAHDLFSYLDLRFLPTIRILLKSKKFLVQDNHPEEQRILLKSGWGLKGVADNFTIIGDHSNFRDKRFFFEEGLYNFFDCFTQNKYTATGVKVISNPFSEGSVGPLELQILDRALTANSI